jgi:hypothetical protein
MYYNLICIFICTPICTKFYSCKKWVLQLIGKVPSGLANSLVGPLYHGPQRNKNLLPYPRPKRSMLQLVVVVHNLFGCETLKDCGYTMIEVPLLCDNEIAINIAYIPCEYYRTKHIDIQHHFLISHVRTNEQLANIFTKPLDERIFLELRSELNITDSHNVASGVAHLI